MNTQKLGKSELISTRLAYGNMRTAGSSDPARITPDMMAVGRKSHVAAYEAGYTLFDTANIYCRGVCETILGQTLKEVSGMRANILVATKCGIRFPGEPEPDSPHRYDFSAAHILQSCDASLKRLGIETIDLYQLHRPDLLMDPAEVAGAFEKLKKAGKVREFGVSNFMPSFVTALQLQLRMPLIVNQVEIHLGRLGCFYDGTLDQCLSDDITPLAWSPLDGGWLGTGRSLKADDPKHHGKQKLLDLLDKTAADHRVSRTVISLAWLMRHPGGIIPIIGSNNSDHIRDAARADELELSREEWYRLLVAARMEALA